MLRSVLLGLAMLVFGGALAFGGGRSIYRAYTSQRWPVAQGHVLSNSVEKLRSRRSVSFMPHVSYEYAVNGKSYTSETLAFGAGITAGALEDANAYVHHYPKGAEVPIHYAPDDAALACLDCGSVGIADYVVAAGGTALLALALYGLLDALRSVLKSRDRVKGGVPAAGARARRT